MGLCEGLGLLPLWVRACVAWFWPSSFALGGFLLPCWGLVPAWFFGALYGLVGRLALLCGWLELAAGQAINS